MAGTVELGSDSGHLPLPLGATDGLGSSSASSWPSQSREGGLTTAPSQGPQNRSGGLSTPTLLSPQHYVTDHLSALSDSSFYTLGYHSGNASSSGSLASCVYPATSDAVSMTTAAMNCNGSGVQTGNASHPLSPPPDMSLTEDRLVAVIAYGVLFLVAATGNLTVFITLFRNRHRKSRVNRFILHLALADLIVTFVMMPLEIAWHLTVAWLAGDVACRVLMFFRAFGFYLSSFILVTISLDRYFAILHPLSLNDADRRGRTMLLFAWSFSFASSIPQVTATPSNLSHPNLSYRTIQGGG